MVKKTLQWVAFGILWCIMSFLCWLSQRLSPSNPPQSEGPDISYVQPGDGAGNIPGNHAE